MKIIVNNEKEQALIKKFIKEFRECDIAHEIHRISCEDEPLAGLGSDEATIIDFAFDQCRIVVDEQEKSILLEEDDMVTGTCVVCGTKTHGMSDCYDDITYEQYIDMMSSEEQEKWLCEECFQEKERDQQCQP